MSLILADARQIPLRDGCVQCCVTSPPYFGLRAYLPNTVRLRDDISDEERARVISELARLGVFPTSDVA